MSQETEVATCYASKSITSIDYTLTENAVRVLQARYLKRDEAGQPLETPDDMFRRVAGAIADIETSYPGGEPAAAEWAQKYYELMVTGRFMPNSPTLMNAGRSMGMLSACFVLPLEDSIDGIFSTVRATAQIQKAGGGTGFSFDRLRPTGDYINSSGGTTSGPISFWKVLSEATNAIQQGAFRRGANMGMMSITHPDILKFVNAKQDLQAFTNFNISVKVPDHWMAAYRQDAKSAHIVINPRNGDQYVMPKNLNAATYDIRSLVSLADYQATAPDARPEVWSSGEFFDIIITNAWRTGEPGLIFEDEINRWNPTPHVGRIEATNPCGEQPLLPYEACNLGSVNLASFVQTDRTGAIWYDWDGLRDAVHTSVRFLDNVIDVNRFPVQEITDMVQGNRKIGLGIMGFADALYKIGVAYDSDEGLAWGEKWMKCLNDEAHNASEKLAEERGCFPNWEGSLWDTKYNRKMRHAATTTVAPTGTISIIAGCSGGVEPLFSLAFFRQVLGGQRLAEVNEIFRSEAERGGFYSKEMIEQVAREGSIQHVTSIPAPVRRVYVCSHDITAEWHVKMQAAFQKHCDSSISKTINLHHDATPAEVRKIYELAFDLQCKGVTVYRDGCRDLQPMALDNAKKEEKKVEAAAVKAGPFVALKPMKTPNILSAVRIRQRTPFGHMHITISVDPRTDRELEVFAQLGKAGDVAMSDLEAMSRLISLYLRIGGALEHIVDQLEGIGSHLSVATKDGRVMSLADGLGKTLHRYLEAKKLHGMRAILMAEVDLEALPSLKDSKLAGQAQAPAALATTSDGATDSYKVKCPECSGTLSFSEGCVKCNSCGFSKC
jgi:ribonucleoside-diphosphate reductase alpha chain